MTELSNLMFYCLSYNLESRGISQPGVSHIRRLSQNEGFLKKRMDLKLLDAKSKDLSLGVYSTFHYSLRKGGIHDTVNT